MQSLSRQLRQDNAILCVDQVLYRIRPATKKCNKHNWAKMQKDRTRSMEADATYISGDASALHRAIKVASRSDLNPEIAQNYFPM